MFVFLGVSVLDGRDMREGEVSGGRLGVCMTMERLCKDVLVVMEGVGAGDKSEEEGAIKAGRDFRRL